MSILLTVQHILSGVAPTEAGPIRDVDESSIPKPQPSVDTEFFWQSGEDGFLRIQRCTQCERYAHPPTPRCRNCGALGPQPTVVSGHATVFSYTISHHTFVPWLPAPYVLAIVELEEDHDVHLTTRIVDIPHGDVKIGLPVSVIFERHQSVYLPVFGPRRNLLGGSHS